MRQADWRTVTRDKTIVDSPGLLDSLLYYVDRVLRVLPGRFRLIRYYFAVQPVPSGGLASALRTRGIEVRPIERGDPALEKIPRPGEVIAARFAQDAVCLGAFKHAELVAFGWFLIDGDYLEDEVRSRFCPRPERTAGWDFDIFVFPAHRAGFAFPRLWAESDAWLASRGMRWTMSRISAYNRRSLVSHASLGARIVGSATYLCLGSWQLTISSLRPRLHLSLRASDLPAFEISPPRARARC